MNKPTLTAVAVLAVLALGTQVSAQAAAPAPASVGAKAWVGHYAEIEEHLRTAPIERVEDVPLGVTKPKRAFFAPATASSASTWCRSRSSAARPWVLGDAPVREMLKRRDKIVARFEKLARERGEAAVFPF